MKKIGININGWMFVASAEVTLQLVEAIEAQGYKYIGPIQGYVKPLKKEVSK